MDFAFTEDQEALREGGPRGKDDGQDDHGAHGKPLEHPLEMGPPPGVRYSRRATWKRVSCCLGASHSGLSSTAFW